MPYATVKHSPLRGVSDLPSECLNERTPHVPDLKISAGLMDKHIKMVVESLSGDAYIFAKPMPPSCGLRLSYLCPAKLLFKEPFFI